MKNKVQIVLVYILEAHASDTWPMGWSVEWLRPRFIEQRQDYARQCLQDLSLDKCGVRVLVDGMANSFNKAFASWPTAYYVVSSDAVLLHVGEPDQGQAGYDVNRTFAFVRRLVAEKA